MKLETKINKGKYNYKSKQKEVPVRKYFNSMVNQDKYSQYTVCELRKMEEDSFKEHDEVVKYNVGVRNATIKELQADIAKEVTRVLGIEGKDEVKFADKLYNENQDEDLELVAEELKDKVDEAFTGIVDSYLEEGE